MEKELPKKELKLINSDKQYLDEYFKICILLNKKRELIGVGKKASEINKNKEKEEAAKDCKSRIASINKELKRKEELFWERVKKSLKCRKSFVIEELAAYYSLNNFEKKVFIFFIYLEFYHRPNSMCSESEILALFDYRDSIVERIKRVRHFTYSSPLIKNKILAKGGRKPYPQNFQEYALSYAGLELISKVLDGEKLEDVQKEKNSGFDRVGYQKIPRYLLDDVKLASEIKDKIIFFLSNYKDNFLEKIGAGRVIKNNKNLIFLFYGPPGTGKSMLAEAIASYLGKKMLLVEFPKITSRWLGSTDKNISKMFKTAQENDMILSIDEADSLLYNRSYAQQDHNIRFVNIMLQEIERFEGVAVLTTNLDKLLDQAIERRVSLKVKLEKPDEKLREKIWQSHIPKSIRLSKDVDFVSLAKKYDFTGGYIKNAVFNAMRKIGKEKRKTIRMDDFIFGAEIESSDMFAKENKAKIGFGGDKYVFGKE